MVLGTGQSLKIWRYGNLILPDTTSIYQYCLSMLGKAQFMIQWLKNALLGAISIFQRAFYAEKSAMQKFTIKISERYLKMFHHLPHSGSISIPIIKNTVASSFSFSISSISMSVLEGNLCLLFFDEFPYFLYSFPAHLAELANIRQATAIHPAWNLLCVGSSASKGPGFSTNPAWCHWKKDDKMWFLWDLMGLYGDLLGFNQQKNEHCWDLPLVIRCSLRTGSYRQATAHFLR